MNALPGHKILHSSSRFFRGLKQFCIKLRTETQGPEWRGRAGGCLNCSCSSNIEQWEGTGAEYFVLRRRLLAVYQFTKTWQRRRPGSAVYSCALGISLQGCWQTNCSSGNAVLSMRDPKTVPRKDVRSLPSLSFEQTKCLTCFSESL